MTLPSDRPEAMTLTSLLQIHEELVKQLTSLLQPNTSDFHPNYNFLKNSWFFFDIIIKSVSQYLLSTGRIKVQ